MVEPSIQTKLPENAYRELKPGETYVPMVPSDVAAPEVTLRSVLFGLAMNIVFAMAATYLALKVGQGIETAIPISILAVGLSGFLAKLGARRSSILENVNILAIGTTSGIVSGGTCFTMPALYILGLNDNLHLSGVQLFLLIFLVPFLGAVLGVVFLVPFRRYFVKEMHGKLPFPEATATNEILATGASGSTGQAWVLIYSFGLAMVYNFLSKAMNLFGEVFTTGEAVLKAGNETVRTLAFQAPFFETLTHKVKAIFSMGTGAYYAGLGFVIGTRYASIICAGSFFSWFALIPLLGVLDLDQLQKLNPAVPTTGADDIFRHIPKVIGVGGIFTAGILSILKMSPVMVTALRQAIGGLFAATGATTVRDRADQDIDYPRLLLVGVLTGVGVAVYFRCVAMAGMPGATRLTIIAVLLALGIAFLFTTVSAWAIAMISVTPISGMTVTTVIVTAVALMYAGLSKGDRGMLAVLLVGGVVAAALSMAGTLVTEFKIGYWLGASPRRIQWSAIIASFLASALVSIVIMILAYKPGFVATQANPDPLSAPQANLVASTLKSFIGTGQVPWLLYGVGAAIALILQLVGVSPLAFSLGMYLSLELNTPILLGAVVAALTQVGAKNEAVGKARNDKGILIASGLIAGAAIVEVLINALMIFDEKVTSDRIMPALDMSRRLIAGGTDPESLARFNNALGLAMFLALCVFIFWDVRRARADGN